MFKYLSTAVCLFFLGMCVPAHGQETVGDRFVYFYPSIYRISPENRISRFELPENEEMFLSIFGSTSPQVSPDQLWIAFTKENDLWLYNTRTQTMRRATHVGRPYTEKLASVLVLVMSWSADSTRVLVKVVAGETECVDCEDRGDWKKRKSTYGYFAYSVRTGGLSKIALPEDFSVWDWRADGRLVGSREFSEDPSPVMVVPGAKPQPIHGLERRSVAGLSLSRDGGWAVAATSEYNTSHIVRVDLKASEAVALTAEGTSGEYEAVEISPADKHVSWVHRTGAVNAGIKQLVVDGKTVFTCAQELLVYEWLDKQRIALNCGGRVQVVDERVEEASK
jgi:hypothetical protein